MEFASGRFAKISTRRKRPPNSSVPATTQNPRFERGSGSGPSSSSYARIRSSSAAITRRVRNLRSDTFALMPEEIAPNVLSWASELDELTRAQAAVTARLPILAGHLALMPDAHLGKGATIGSVIPTASAVIPSAVGVDIGCGMAARRLDLRHEELPDGLDPWISAMGSAVPAGLGRWHGEPTASALRWFAENPPPPTLDDPGRAVVQLGTLGSGNHFIELASDEDDRVWILLHSGSRGGGNK